MCFLKIIMAANKKQKGLKAARLSGDFGGSSF